MSVELFLSDPWKRSHRAYDESVFNIRPAPEFATAEVLVASLYRASGFAEHAESDVPAAGRQLDKASSKSPRSEANNRISRDTWRTILHGALESPKQPKQSSRRFLQVCPLVPDASLYSGSARLSGNSWDPGQLIQRMIQLGCPSRLDAEQLWMRLHSALSVHDDDDVWARWLQAEFERRRIPAVVWQPTSLTSHATLPDGEKIGLITPSGQFVRDLSAILRSKGSMTRRQWVSLLESVVRLGTVAHVLWLCDVNDRLWRATKAALEGRDVPADDALTRLVGANEDNYLVYGRPALPIIRELAARYLSSRLGLNLILWRLNEVAPGGRALASLHDVGVFLRSVKQFRDKLEPAVLFASLSAVEDREARTMTCKKGIGSNLVEFCRHSLGQRQTADPHLRGYDQGYQLRKRADYASAPWIVSLGPVALLALVHCCLEQVAGPRSIQRLCEHLSRYGLEVDMDNAAKSDLGRDLRMLGLVLDSPDAESGMLLIPPFDLRAIEPGAAR